MSPECIGLSVVVWQALDQLDGLLVFAMSEWCVLKEWKTMCYEEAIRKHFRGSEVGKKCPGTQLALVIHLLMSAEDLCTSLF